MTQAGGEDLTRVLRAWSNGDKAALDRLMPVVFDELRRMAHRYMAREGQQHTLQATALVNEAFLRLTRAEEVRWQDRAHFFAVSAQIMRRILVDAARAKQYEKRGGGVARVALDEGCDVGTERGRKLVALDDALNTLAQTDPRKAQVVEMRYFGGLSVEETAAVLQVSVETVMRDWRLAKSWLAREIARRP
jgi:RNA polymerase sigma-70 factor, ECF subfamily